jgi:hypothetical protein
VSRPASQPPPPAGLGRTSPSRIASSPSEGASSKALRSLRASTRRVSLRRSARRAVARVAFCREALVGGLPADVHVPPSLAPSARQLCCEHGNSALADRWAKKPGRQRRGERDSGSISASCVTSAGGEQQSAHQHRQRCSPTERRRSAQHFADGAKACLCPPPAALLPLERALSQARPEHWSPLVDGRCNYFLVLSRRKWPIGAVGRSGGRAAGTIIPGRERTPKAARRSNLSAGASGSLADERSSFMLDLAIGAPARRGG